MITTKDVKSYVTISSHFNRYGIFMHISIAVLHKSALQLLPFVNVSTIAAKKFHIRPNYVNCSTSSLKAFVMLLVKFVFVTIPPLVSYTSD